MQKIKSLYKQMYKTFTVKIDYHMQLSDLVFKHKHLLSFSLSKPNRIYSLIYELCQPYSAMN